MIFTPSPAELALVTEILAKADPQKTGIVVVDAAVKVLEGSKLSPDVLANIWDIADEGNNGWLTRNGVIIAVRLMGWAQKGELNMTEAFLNKRECTFVVHTQSCG
jgi:epidermal growth factor receptor substrate 15